MEYGIRTLAATLAMLNEEKSFVVTEKKTKAGVGSLTPKHMNIVHIHRNKKNADSKPSKMLWEGNTHQFLNVY